MKYLSFFICFILFLVIQSKGQSNFTDTVTILSYNINNYGTASTKSCPLEGSSLKNVYLKNILSYLNAPDIVSFQKMMGTPVTLASDSMQKHIMDSVCAGCFANTTYTNVSGYNKVNTLFYKKRKFGYLGTKSIYTADNSISDINLHKLYYKSPSLSTLHDTIFLNVIVVHDASGASSDAQRGTEIKGAMKWLSTNVKQEGNFLFLGDFNTQNSSESCFQAMINPTDTTTRFYEPTNKLGDWAGSPKLFANYLTQSTRRVDPGDCASTNTMTAWFDHILCSGPIMRGSQHVIYIPSTFKVIGQDGLHTGIAINDAPTNKSVPPDVLNSLYMMSEHLPVQVKLLIGNGNNLPIGFDYFKVSQQNGYSSLQWKINNNDFAVEYQIERSENGKDYVTIATLKSTKGNLAEYHYLDFDKLTSTSLFYRIKEILSNGSYLYSNVSVIATEYTNNSIDFVMSPNPVIEKISISSFCSAATIAKLNVMNMQGKMVFSKNIQLNAGYNSFTLDNLSKLTKGAYIVNIQTDRSTVNKIFIKE